MNEEKWDYRGREYTGTSGNYSYAGKTELSRREVKDLVDAEIEVKGQQIDNRASEMLKDLLTNPSQSKLDKLLEIARNNS